MGQWYFPADADVVNWNNVIDYGGFKWLLTENEKLIHIHHKATADGNVYTLENIEDAINYKVPTGKILKLIFVDDWTDGAETVRLLTTTAADASTGGVKIVTEGAGAASMTGKLLIYDVAAGLYVTGKPLSSNAWELFLTGIEIDA